MREPASRYQAPAQRCGPQAMRGKQLQADFVSQQASAWRTSRVSPSLQLADSQIEAAAWQKLQGIYRAQNIGSISWSALRL